MGSGSGCGGCGGLPEWGKSAWAVCAACDGGGWGSGATRTTGPGEVCGIAVAVELGEIGDGSGRDVDGPSGSGSREEAEGVRGGGGGFGMAGAWGRSRLVVMATAITTGGGVIGAVWVMVI
jgi:hypothetical protein